MYLKIILLKAKALSWLSRALGQGNGVMVAGRFILRFAPNSVSKLSKTKRVVLISGTNGKSTTSKLIAEALRTKFTVAHNHTGANMFAGVAAALGADPKAEVAVLEVDELVLPWAIEKTKPELLVLLNLGRDQLDRLSEVRIVSSKWRSAIESYKSKEFKVLASVDDPFVVYSAESAPNKIWFTAQDKGHIDAATCPKCGELLNWSEDGTYYSCKCGFKKPTAMWKLVGDELIGTHQLDTKIDTKVDIKVRSAIPGKAALQNAARALIVAKEFGVELDEANGAISQVKSVDGRFGIKEIGRTKFRLMLSKNPASWRETLATSNSSNVLLVVNANTQDGKDTSWLWDVDFKPLLGREILVTGDRRIDVSARLIVDGVKHKIVDNEIEAAKLFGETNADLIASYTAFHKLVNR